MNMKNIIACDVGNGYGKAALLRASDRDPEYLMPESLAAGMPTTAYVTTTGKIEVYPVRRPSANRAIRAVKTRLNETSITLQDKSKTYTVAPGEVYAAIARDLVTLANTELKNRRMEPAYQLVLTYPASFAQSPELLSRLKQSVESVTLDGQNLQVRGMLPEPASVALDYLYYLRHLNKNPIAEKEFTVLVYDLGHGTFDTAVVTAYADHEKPYDLRSQDGDPEVGGRIFDDILYRELCSQLKDVEGYTPGTAGEYLKNLAVEIKHELSSSQVSERDIPIGLEGATVRITRERFESLIAPQIHRTLELVMSQLEQARQRDIKVDAIILSGGSSQIPVIRQALTELTGGKLPVDIYRPSKAVAYGAARYAQGIVGTVKPDDSQPLTTQESRGNSSMTQHADRSYGLWLPEEGSLTGAIQFLIDTDAALPCRSETLTVPTSGSDRTRLCLYRTADRAPGAKKGDLGECKNVRNLFFSLPRDTDCAITLEMDENRCIKVFCQLPDGSTVTKTTFDAIVPGKEQ